MHFAEKEESTIYYSVYKSQDRIKGDYSDIKKAVHKLEKIGFVARSSRLYAPSRHPVYGITDMGAEYLLDLNESDWKPTNFEVSKETIEKLHALDNYPTKKIVIQLLNSFDQRVIHHLDLFINLRLVGREPLGSTNEIVKVLRGTRRTSLDKEELRGLLRDYLLSHPILSYYLESANLRKLVSECIAYPFHDRGRVSDIIKESLPARNYATQKVEERQRKNALKILKLLDR